MKNETRIHWICALKNISIHCTHTVRWRELEAKRRCDWYAEIDVSNSCCIGSRHLRHRRQCSSGTAWIVKIVPVIFKFKQNTRAHWRELETKRRCDWYAVIGVSNSCFIGSRNLRHRNFKYNDYVIEYFLAVHTVKSRVERFFPSDPVLCHTSFADWFEYLTSDRIQFFALENGS